MGGSVAEEEAVAKVEEVLEFHKRKIMQIVYGKSRSSSVDRECKELVWKSCKLAYCFYGHDGGDEFSSPHNILKDINAMMFDPLP